MQICSEVILPPVKSTTPVSNIKCRKRTSQQPVSSFLPHSDGNLRKPPPPRRNVSGADRGDYLFLCRSSFSCFLRLCLAIFFRRFFFRLPIILPQLTRNCFPTKSIIHLKYHIFGKKATAKAIIFPEKRIFLPFYPILHAGLAGYTSSSYFFSREKK